LASNHTGKREATFLNVPTTHSIGKISADPQKIGDALGILCKEARIWWSTLRVDH